MANLTKALRDSKEINELHRELVAIQIIAAEYVYTHSSDANDMKIRAIKVTQLLRNMRSLNNLQIDCTPPLVWDPTIGACV